MSEDLIKRSDAIDVLYNYQESVEMGIKSFPLAVKAMNDIPSADRPQGEWIPHKQENGKTVLWKCSECGQIIFSETETDRLEFQKWCSRCGARMKGADDEHRG